MSHLKKNEEYIYLLRKFIISIKNQNAGGQQQQPQSAWKIFQSIATRMLIFYFVMQAINQFKGKPNVTQPSEGGSGSDSNIPTPANFQLGNVFPKGTRFDIYVFISESSKFDEFENENALFWMIPDVEYGNWNIGPNGDGVFTYESQIPLTPVR